MNLSRLKLSKKMTKLNDFSFEDVTGTDVM